MAGAPVLRGIVDANFVDRCEKVSSFQPGWRCLWGQDRVGLGYRRHGVSLIREQKMWRDVELRRSGGGALRLLFLFFHLAVLNFLSCFHSFSPTEFFLSENPTSLGWSFVTHTKNLCYCFTYNICRLISGSSDLVRQQHPLLQLLANIVASQRGPRILQVPLARICLSITATSQARFILDT